MKIFLKISLTVIVISVLFALCNRKQIDLDFAAEPEIRTSVIPSSIGDHSRTPDIYTPELEMDWDGYPWGFGVRSPGSGIIYGFVDEEDSVEDGLPLGWHVLIKYSCPIANKTLPDSTITHPDWSQNDLVIDMVKDGIPWNGDYLFPDMLEVKVYKDGKRVSKVQKQGFYIGNTSYKIGIDYTKTHDYHFPLMGVSSQCADEYLNHAVLPSMAEDSSKAVPGKYVVWVHVNPKGALPDVDLSNNYATLPFRVDYPNSFQSDLSAIQSNKPVPVDALQGYYDGRGRDKKVILSFRPDIEPVKILKDGIMIMTGVADSLITIPVDNNFKQGFFTVIKMIPGLPEGYPVSITVKK